MKQSAIQKCIKLPDRLPTIARSVGSFQSRIGNPEPFPRGARFSHWSSSSSQWILVRRRVHGSMDTYFGGRRRDCESYSYLWHSENNDPEHRTEPITGSLHFLFDRIDFQQFLTRKNLNPMNFYKIVIWLNLIICVKE